MSVFLHVDLDAFFASVEQLDHPEWKGLPVIVGGLPAQRRGVVSAASYEARAFGIRSAMSLFQAARLCPEAIYVRPRMRRYHEKSEEIMDILRNYSPDIRQISVDEAFVDLSGTERLFGDPEQTALKMKREIFEQSGLTVSIGMASTKYVAKNASEINKPNGFFRVKEGFEKDFMLSLPLEKVWGIGSKTLKKLNSAGIMTSKSVYEKSKELLMNLFGRAAGSFLYNAVRGLEFEGFDRETKSRSLSAEKTYSFDLTDRYAIETAILELCHTVLFRMRKENVRSKTAALKIRYEDFTTVSAQETSNRYISSTEDLFERVRKLSKKKLQNGKGVRLLGVSLQNAECEGTPVQGELFDFGEEKKRKVEDAIFKTQTKHPQIKIVKARLLTKPEDD